MEKYSKIRSKKVDKTLEKAADKLDERISEAKEVYKTSMESSTNQKKVYSGTVENNPTYSGRGYRGQRWRTNQSTAIVPVKITYSRHKKPRA